MPFLSGLKEEEGASGIRDPEALAVRADPGGGPQIHPVTLRNSVLKPRRFCVASPNRDILLKRRAVGQGPPSVANSLRKCGDSGRKGSPAFLPKTDP